MTSPRPRAVLSDGPALRVVPDPDTEGPEDDDSAEVDLRQDSADGADRDELGAVEEQGESSEIEVAGDVDGSDASAQADSGAPDDAEERTPLELAREVLAQADPAATYRMVSGLARPSHHEVLQPLAYSPALEFHDPTCVVVDPEPNGVETVELYAHAAYPDFDRVLVQAFADPLVDGTLTALYHLIVEENENVALVTNHGQIIDIALVIGALEAAMLAPDRTFGVLGERSNLDDLADRMNVLVSRMVTTRQAFSVPALQVLQCGARTFLSVPQTASRRRARIDPEIVKANNIVMRHELDQRLAQGGQLLAMAASGSQDLTLPALVHKARAMWRQRRGDDPGEAPTLHLQPLYDGTVSLMRSCRYVLPVAICLDPATPACAIGGLTRVREVDDCHRIMDWIALAHQEATGVPTLYHWHEDDLLTQVRAFLNR